MGLRVVSNPPQENVVSRLSKFEPRGEEIWSGMRAALNGSRSNKFLGPTDG